jgi:hypothetical protein
VGRKAEVEDLDPPVRRDEQVLRLEVAVDDAFVVRRRETARNLGGVLNCLALGQRAAGQPLAQRLSFEHLRHGIHPVVVRAEVVDREDARVRSRRVSLAR